MEVNVSNDLMFRLLMENKKYCMYVLETLLEMKLRKITILSPQLSIEVDVVSKGIRLDILVEDLAGNCFLVEMQTGKTPYIGKRFRYYQSMADMGRLKKGESYDKLKESYIIFICTFDQFGRDRYRYSFQMECLEEAGISLSGAPTWLFFNTECKKSDIPKETRNLLHFIADSSKENAIGPLLEQMYEDAEELCTGEWREQLMTMEMRLKEREELGRERGKAEGRSIGKIEGKIEALNNMITSGIPKEAAIDILKLTAEEAVQYESFKQP